MASFIFMSASIYVCYRVSTKWNIHFNGKAQFRRASLLHQNQIVNQY